MPSRHEAMKEIEAFWFVLKLLRQCWTYYTNAAVFKFETILETNETYKYQLYLSIFTQNLLISKDVIR